jgi:hypothetical protein
MKSVFGRYLYLCYIGIALEAFTLIIVLIDTFKYTNGIAESAFNTISGSKIVLNIFNFIVDWAIVFSLVSVLFILIALFLNYKKYRRNRALAKIHDWAKNSILLLADYRQRDSSLQDSPEARHEGIKVLTEALNTHGRTTLADGQIVGGELNTKIIKAMDTLSAINDKVSRQDESSYSDLRTLQHNMADVMMSTFEYLRRI